MSAKQPQTIRAAELAHWLKLDPWYGVIPTSAKATESVVCELQNANEQASGAREFVETWRHLPWRAKSDLQAKLVRLWCVMGLPAFQAGKSLNWAPVAFARRWEDDFEITLDDLANFLERNRLPLPERLFPQHPRNSGTRAIVERYKREVSRFKQLPADSIREEMWRENRLGDLNRELGKIKDGTASLQLRRRESSGQTVPTPELPDATPIRRMVVPKRKDDWYEAIVAAITEFESEHNHTPKEAQLWVKLCKAPPKAYGIEQSKDRGESAITLAGDKPLDREAFSKRYRRLYPSRTP